MSPEFAVLCSSEGLTWRLLCSHQSKYGHNIRNLLFSIIQHLSRLLTTNAVTTVSHTFYFDPVAKELLKPEIMFKD